MEVNSLSRKRLSPSERLLLQEALNAVRKKVDIRLRIGEYQYALAKAIASFLLELYFPNVKELTEKLYGNEKAESVKFRRNVQTILKKMEKSDVVRILPKKKPWELQAYGLSSFKFEDVDKSQIILATEEEIEKAEEMLDFLSSERKPASNTTRIFALLLMIVASYTAVLWGLTQAIINPLIFISAFSFAVVFSVMLGKMLSGK